MKNLILSLLLTFFVSAQAQRAPASGTPAYARLADADPQLKSLVERVTDGQATAGKWFAGPSNLLGVIITSVENPENPGVVAWATPDKQYLFLGMLVDKDQRNLTNISAQYYEAIEPAISLNSLHTKASPDTFYSDYHLKNNLLSILSFLARQGHAVAEGSGARTMFVFIDPYCPYCKQLSDTIRSNQDLTRDMTVYYFPVILAESNLDAAAQILTNGAQSIDRFHEKNTEGLAPADDDARSRVMMNNALLVRISTVAEMSELATPTVIVQQDGEPNVYQGSIKAENFAGFLETIQKPDILPIEQLVQLPEEGDTAQQ